MLITDQVFEKQDTFNNQNEYECCTFKNCDFSNGNFSTSKFIDCEFEECNLSNIIVNETSFRGVNFKGCKMIGIQFENSNKLLFDAAFENCQLNNCTFFQMKLKKYSFSNCELQEVDFSESDLSGSSILSCDLTNARFEYTNLEGTDFSNSHGITLDPEINKISKAKIPHSQLVGLLTKYNFKVLKDQ